VTVDWPYVVEAELLEQGAAADDAARVLVDFGVDLFSRGPARMSSHVSKISQVQRTTSMMDRV
jgi:hypothetical protein